MKVTLKYNLGAYSGTLNDMTYSSYREGAVCIGRKWVKPAETTQQTEIRSIAQNLALLYKEVNPAYKQDLKAYAAKYAQEVCPRNQIPPNSYALWLKMMYAWKDSDSEHVFLDSLSMDDIESMEAPVMSLKDAIEGKLLPRTSNAGQLTAEIVEA